MKSSINYSDIKKSLSNARLSTYEKTSKNTIAALEIYRWNLQISSALLECLAVCEIVIRNAISEAIQQAYSHNWATDTTFLASLPQNMRETLNEISKKHPNIDKTIPELPFFFWQSLLTKRFDKNIWNNQLLNVFPNLASNHIPLERLALYKDLDSLRKLRNRIAHHEPIFTRSHQEDYNLIKKIIGYRSQDTANWMDNWQNITELLNQKP